MMYNENIIKKKTITKLLVGAIAIGTWLCHLKVDHARELCPIAYLGNEFFSIKVSGLPLELLGDTLPDKSIPIPIGTYHQIMGVKSEYGKIAVCETGWSASDDHQTIVFTRYLSVRINGGNLEVNHIVMGEEEYVWKKTR